jgi:casein kinase II subunit beta
LTGLNTLVPYYDYALDMVLDVEMPMEDSLTEEQQEIVESAAEMLYGLIHARYVLSLLCTRQWNDGVRSVSL